MPPLLSGNALAGDHIPLASVATVAKRHVLREIVAASVCSDVLRRLQDGCTIYGGTP